MHLITRGAIIDVASHHVTSLIVLILASCSADVELGGQPDFAASKVVRAEFSQIQAPNPKLYKCTDTHTLHLSIENDVGYTFKPLFLKISIEKKINVWY